MTTTVKTYAADLHLTLLGTMTLNVDAVPAKRSAAKVDLKMISPTREEPTQLPQVYWDEERDEHFSQGAMARARLVDGVLHPISPEEIVALKTPILPPGEATVHPYKQADIEDATKPGGTLYLLKPHATKGKGVPNSVAKIYALFVDIIAASEYAWVMEMTIRSEQKMFRLISWNGRLALQELIRPGEFNEVPLVDFDYDERLVPAVEAAADAHVREFNADEFLNYHRERAAQLDEALSNGEMVAPVLAEVAAVSDEADDDALLAMLSASVSQVRKAS